MRFPKVFSIIIALSLHIFSISLTCHALEKPGTELEEVGIAPILGNRVDLDLNFIDSDGKSSRLGELVAAGKPIVVIPAYFGCPRLCGLLLDGVSDLLSELTLKIGQDFTILTASFNVSEMPADALKRGKSYWSKQSDPEASRLGWRFLTGDSANVTALMNQIGFKYKPDGKDFAHTAAIVILTPEGEISQYFTGVSFSAFDTRLALVEASKGNIGTPLDHVLLYCFRFDQSIGKYTWAVFNLMRAGGILTVLALGGLIFYLRRREKAQQLAA